MLSQSKHKALANGKAVGSQDVGSYLYICVQVWKDTASPRNEFPNSRYRMPSMYIRIPLPRNIQNGVKYGARVGRILPKPSKLLNVVVAISSSALNVNKTAQMRYQVWQSCRFKPFTGKNS